MGVMRNRLMLIVLFLILLTEAAAAQRRTALVIGNAGYVSASALTNPSNDASAVAKSLRDLDFSVTLALDLDKAGFEKQIRDFAASLDGASAAVFFYAGHGLQVDGRNYLVPVDAKVANEADLPFELVSLDIVLQKMAGYRITSIIILDACRDNPLGEKLAKVLGERAKAVGQGLANVYASAGTLISFSTQPGNIALDGGGSNSPFTKALLHHVATPNVDVLAMLRQVRRDVIEETRQRQVPWDNSSLVDEFMFKPSGGQSARRSDGISDNGAKPEPKPRPERPNDDSAIPLPPDIRPVLEGKPPVHACDHAAASATDPERVVAGNTMGELNGAEGVRACRAALALYPRTPRFEFQLARSLHKSEAYSEAAQRYRSLVERGYFAALTNYGWMLNFGHGVKRDPAAAVRLYMLAAQQGDMFGMYNVAMAYDTGSGIALQAGPGCELGLRRAEARPRLFHRSDERRGGRLDP